MKLSHHLPSGMALVAVLALGACATTDGNSNSDSRGSPYPPSSSSNSGYQQYGVVQSIDLVRVDHSGIGVGAIAGAVIGGIVGNQVGGGSGNTAATVLGAAGGAYAGHELEKRNQTQSDATKLIIRMNDGSYQSVTQTSSGDVRVGDRVRIQNGAVSRY